MQSFQKTLHAILLTSLSSHIFCCGIPTFVAVVSLITGLGYITAPWIEAVHNIIHAYEVPVLIFSAVMLALGWVVDALARRVDCHDTGCCHEPYAPKKKRAHWILFVATALFVINVGVFFYENYVVAS